MSSTKDLVITRTFNAPRELVFKAFSEAERMGKWWAPPGMTIQVVRFEFRPGGMFLYCSKNEQFEMWGRFVYGDIAAPERIVFISSFSDKDGNITKSQFHPVWPLEIKNTMTLTEADGTTTMELRGGPINATAEEIQTFEDNAANMQQGFKCVLDQLEAYLAGAE